MIIGIDLGTTNSAVGIWRDGRAELIPNSLGSVLTPSAVSIDDSGELLVGLAARERQVTHPELTATAFKRYMGSKRITRLGKREFLPEELSALVLRRLKADAEQFLGETVTDAVITVPAYFNDKQRQATRRAGQLAGLNVERLLNEPTAAALTYGIHQKDVETRFLVFDLGGGTFDVTVLELFEGVIEVRASTGDNMLGGEDFNELLIDEFFQARGHDMKLTSKRGDAGAYERIREQAERARRKLSTEPTATMKVTWKDQEHVHEVSDEGFERSARSLITRLRDPVLRALRDSDVHVEKLDQIVLVGGATRMPIVRRSVTKMFGRFPASTVNPDEAVALGAAVQAGLKARDIDLKEVVLTDVCPYSLGIEASEELGGGTLRGGIFSPIIERNTLIPASRVKTFVPVHEGQSRMEVNIFQGESRKVVDNIALGSVTVPIPPGPAHETHVDVRFTYDIDGVLEVEVHVPRTGERRELTITDEDDELTPDDLRKRSLALAALKVHPRDQDVNRAVVARAERCWEQALGEQRDLIAEWLRQYTTALETQDPRVVEASRTRMIAALDEFEGQTFL
jgi:molecular chaperone HscC